MVEQSSGVRAEDHGRVIWSWDEASERDGGAKEKKSSITVRRLHCLNTVEGSLIRHSSRHPTE